MKKRSRNTKTRGERTSHRGVYFACLTCRVAFKKPSVDLLGVAETAHFPCPNCGKAMQYMGRSFKAPRRNAVRKWRIVGLLIRDGYRFESLGSCRLPGTRRELEAWENQSPEWTMNRLRHYQVELRRRLRSDRIGGKKASVVRK